jgi:RNA polymerase sigma factor (sigma-70 family)
MDAMTAETGPEARVVALEDGATGPATRLVAESGDTASFEAIYEAHFHAVFRYAILRTGRRDEADDVVSETFARAMAAWRAGRGPAERPLPWLLLICRRIVTDRWRRNRLIGWLPLTGRGRAGGRDPGDARDIEPVADDLALETREFWLWLDALTRALPDRQREVLFLRYDRDLTDDEIGAVLGLTPSGVRSLVARAIESLRRHPELLS